MEDVECGRFMKCNLRRPGFSSLNYSCKVFDSALIQFVELLMGSKLSFLHFLWTLSLCLTILPRSHSSSSEDDDDADLGIDDAVYLDTIETALDAFLSFPRMAVEEVSLAADNLPFLFSSCAFNACHLLSDFMNLAIFYFSRVI